MSHEVPIEPLRTVLDRALGWFEAFRKLNFVADDIYIQLNGNGPTQVLQELHTQGKKFSVHCGVAPEPAEAIAEEWTRRAEWWNGAGDEARRRIYEAVVMAPGPHRVQFVMAIVAQGIVLPARGDS